MATATQPKVQSTPAPTTDNAPVPANVKPIKPSPKAKKASTMAADSTQNTPSTPQPRRTPKSRAFLYRTYEFGCLAARQMISRNFDIVAIKLFNLSVILPVLTTDDDAVDKLDDHLDEIFTTCEKEFSDGIEQIKALLGQENIVDLCQYDDPLVRNVRIDSPNIARFMNCVRLLDQFQQLLETAWLSGLVSTRDRKITQMSWRKKIQKLAQRIIGLEGRARGAIKREGKEQQATSAGAILDDGGEQLHDISSEAHAEAEA